MDHILTKNTDDSIESLRAIAIILVLGIHVTGDPVISESTNLYGYLSHAFVNVRMPLFTVISGYLYAHRRVIQGAFQSYLEGKARRILVPLIFVSSCEFISKSILPGVNNPTDLQEIWKVAVYPYEHYWFLQAIFVIFLLVGVLDYLKIIGSFRSWVILFICSIIVSIGYADFKLSITFFSIGHATYLLPYFIIGYGLVVFRNNLFTKRIVNIALFAFFVAYLCQNYLWFSSELAPSSPRSMLGVIVSSTACFLLMYYRKPIWGARIIGSYAFTIYLYQGFALSLARRISQLFSIQNPHIYFIFMISFAIAFGITVAVLVSKIPTLRKLMLGVR